MPDKKITDNEIKKALECCGEYSDCPHICPLRDMAYVGDCIQVKAKAALDLINRQEALIDKLEKVEHFADKTIATLQAENESLKAEVERLNTNISAMATTLSTSARATRHEAYKEFANELKCRTHEISYNTMQVVNKDDINNLLNELVGDGDGKRKD